MRINNFILLTVLLGLGLTVLSCEEFVEVDPPNSRVAGALVFENDRLAIAAMDGVYDRMFNSGYFSGGHQNSIAVTAGLSADEFMVSPQNSTLQEFYNNQVSPANTTNSTLWSSAYNIIYMVNSIIEGLSGSEGISPGVKRQLDGEARFVRGFTYFYLVNLFGDVPLITGTDYKVNTNKSRDTVNEVYEQVLLDLEQARALLDSNYRDGQRTRPNRYAASALLARTYLFLQDWETAQKFTTEVIEASNLYGLQNDLNNAFLANNPEAIWQIEPVLVGHTNEGDYLILTEAPANNPSRPLSLTNNILEAFDPQDKRLSNWIDSLEVNNEIFYYPFKYKVKFSVEPPGEYSTVMRLAEQFLIRAEARAHLGDLEGSLDDLNRIRNRSGLNDTQAQNMEQLIEEIFVERQRELFTEWGHRWLDINRLEKEAVLNFKPDWQPSDMLYPIPEQELSRAPKLVQNPGY